ncbi:MAG: hypothetical protein NTY87_11260 [Planctomycetia bacterium]|nr:hypothetical protein [Planctomycetia bacterium]
MAEQGGKTPSIRIDFTQSGGFAGLVKSCTLDNTTLDRADWAVLERLIDSSGLTESLAGMSAAGRDRRCYTLSISRGDGVVVVECDDNSIPAAARPLVAFLTARARPVPPPAT